MVGHPFLSLGTVGSGYLQLHSEDKGQCEPCPRGESHFLFNS